jgi:hypothetical protein
MPDITGAHIAGTVQAEPWTCDGGSGQQWTLG